MQYCSPGKLQNIVLEDHTGQAMFCFTTKSFRAKYIAKGDPNCPVNLGKYDRSISERLADMTFIIVRFFIDSDTIVLSSIILLQN